MKPEKTKPIEIKTQTRTLKQTLIYILFLMSKHPNDRQQKIVAASTSKRKLINWYHKRKDDPILHFYIKVDTVEKFEELKVGITEQWADEVEMEAIENNYYIFLK